MGTRNQDYSVKKLGTVLFLLFKHGLQVGFDEANTYVDIYMLLLYVKLKLLCKLFITGSTCCNFIVTLARVISIILNGF